MVLARRLTAGGMAAAALICCWLLAVASAQAQLRGNAPVVAAASDLQFALQEIAAAFEADTGHGVRLVFGSSGNFARQIRQGAPFELFLSADEEYVLELAREGLTRDLGELYAVGRLALLVPHASPLTADGALGNLAAVLAAGGITRFAIANPDHAPYGRRAEEALRHAGLWDAIEPRLVYGENVSQAAQFVTSGNAQGGIVAYSLALAPAVAVRGRFELIPDEWHRPLNQRMALLSGGGPVAERFYEYLQQPPARSLLRRYGFGLPGETPP